MDNKEQVKVNENDLLVMPAWAVTKLYQYVMSKTVAETGHLKECFDDIKRAQINEPVKKQ